MKVRENLFVCMLSAVTVRIAGATAPGWIEPIQITNNTTWDEGRQRSNRKITKISITFLLSLLTLVIFIAVSSAQECITPTENLTINNSTTICYGTYNINIAINASDIILDCNGSTLYGNGSSWVYGIYADNTSNVTIKNCIVRNVTNGIDPWYFNDSFILNNRVYNVNGDGIRLTESVNSTVDNNTVYDASIGIMVSWPNARNNTVSNNNVSNNAVDGIYLGEAGDYNKVIDNIILNNPDVGIYLEDTSYNIIADNIISGNGVNIFFSYGGSAEGSHNNTIYNNTISNSSDVWWGSDSAGIRIENLCYNNTFYLNRFINNVNHAWDEGVGINHNFNNSLGQGNYWDDLNISNFTDSDSDGFYDSGIGYPYNKSNGGKVSDYVTDWHPCVYENCLALLSMTPGNNSYVKEKEISFTVRGNVRINISDIAVEVNGNPSSSFDPSSCSGTTEVSCEYTESDLVDGKNTITIYISDMGGVNATFSRFFYYKCIEPYENIHINNSTTFCKKNYYLNDSDEDGSIIIDGSNLVLDCNGSTIIGDKSVIWSSAIIVSNQDNVIIKDCIFNNTSYTIVLSATNHTTIKNSSFSNCKLGIYVESPSTNNSFINNTVTNCYDSGIELWSGITDDSPSDIARSQRIVGNNITNVSYGIELLTLGSYPGSDILIADNRIETFENAILVYEQRNVTIIDNKMHMGEDYGIEVVGSSSTWADNITIENNIISDMVLNDSLKSNICDLCIPIPCSWSIGIGLRIEQHSQNVVIKNNTILNTSRAVDIGRAGCGNTIQTSIINHSLYNNSFVNATDLYAYSSVSPPKAAFNSSLYGNYWSDLNASNFTDSDNDGFYDSGIGYPYNKSNGGNVSDNVTDWHPCVYQNCLPPDTTPPASITNLVNVTGITWINWTWENPSNPDFNHTMVYINGSFITNVSGAPSTASYYNNTTLSANTSYKISTHAVDTSGDINSTWVNQTTTTLPYPPPTIVNWSNNKTNDVSLSITINESEQVMFNITADQPITTYSWYKDGVDQNWNYDNNTTSWAVNGTYEVNASVSNLNGSSANKSWSITVNDITAPTVYNLTNDTPTQTTVNLSWSCDATDIVNYSVYQNGTFLNNTTNKYYNVTGLSADTTYEFNVSATDDNSLEGANATINITTAPYPTCSAQGGGICSSRQSCRGSWTTASDTSRCCIGTCYYPSSGRGYATPTPTPAPTPVVVVEVKKQIQLIEANQSEVVTFEEPELDVSEITINVKNNVSGVEITIQKLSGAPPEIKTAPPPTITGAIVKSYSYLNISTTNITDDDINNASINFTVNKSWILEEEVDEDNIRLNRYNNTTANWTALPTNKTGEDNVSAYYSAISPGFSIFAISGERIKEKATPTPTPSPTPISTITPTLASTVTATPDITATSSSSSSPPTVPEGIDIPLIVAAVAIAVVLAIGVFYREKIVEMFRKGGG